MAIAGKIGAVFLQTENAPVNFIKTATQENTERTRYTIIDESYRYLDKSQAVSVYLNDVLFGGIFTVEPLGGVICFEVPLEEEDIVTLSGKSIEVAQVGGFFYWSVELSTDNTEVTTFESGGWKDSMPTIKGFSITSDCYWADEKLSGRLGQEVIVAMYLDTSPNKKRYEGYALMTNDSIEVAGGDVINESLEFEGTDRLFYRED